MRSTRRGDRPDDVSAFPQKLKKPRQLRTAIDYPLMDSGPEHVDLIARAAGVFPSPDIEKQVHTIRQKRQFAQRQSAAKRLGKSHNKVKSSELTAADYMAGAAAAVRQPGDPLIQLGGMRPSISAKALGDVPGFDSTSAAADTATMVASQIFGGAGAGAGAGSGPVMPAVPMPPLQGAGLVVPASAPAPPRPVGTVVPPTIQDLMEDTDDEDDYPPDDPTERREWIRAKTQQALAARSKRRRDAKFAEEGAAFDTSTNQALLESLGTGEGISAPSAGAGAGAGSSSVGGLDDFDIEDFDFDDAFGTGGV